MGGHLALGGTGASGGKFSPDQLTGLELWLKADVGTYTDSGLGTPVTTDGTGVGGWADQSGQSNTCRQSTSSRMPVLKLAQQNGLSTLKSDPNVFTQMLLLNPTSDTAITAFAVFKLIVAGARSPIIANPSNNSIVGHSSTTQYVVRGTGASDNGDACGAVGTTAYHVHGWDGSASASNHYLDSATADGSGTSAGPYQFSHILHDNSSNYLNGYIGEILLYNSVLSLANRTSVINYLGTRWGITIS